jgi:UDP-2,3-diacylglucosamine pyrophosphatase LpxH
VYFVAALLFFIFLVGLVGALVLISLVLAVVLPIVGWPVAMPTLLTPWNAFFVLVIALPFFDVMRRAIYRFGAELYRRVSRMRKFPDAEDRHAQKLFEHLQEICIPLDAENFYGVIGHTHRPDVQVLDRDENRRLIYLNSGTWVPNWRDKRSNLRSGTEFSFLREAFKAGR